MKNMLAVLIMLLMPLIVHAFPPDKTGNCLDCHKLEKKEAEEIVRRFVPNGVVHDVRLGPVKAFWLVEVEAGGRRGMLLLDFTKTYVGSLQPIPKKIDAGKVPLQDAVLLGAKTAKKKVIVFTDPDCPYCRTLHEEMKKVTAKRKDIAFHLIMYPLPSHQEAYPKAQAVLCEKSQKLLDDAFAGKSVPEPKCGNEALERSLALGRELDITGTPTLIREDGIMMSGALPADKLIEWIDAK